MTDFSTVKEGLDVMSGIFYEVDRLWNRVRMKFGRIVVGFKKGNIEYRMETR